MCIINFGVEPNLEVIASLAVGVKRESYIKFIHN